MEDVLYYIGLGLIITFSLVRKAGKRVARKTSKQGSAPKTDSVFGLPTLESVIYEYTRTKESKSAGPKNVDEFDEAQSLETIIDEEEEYMQKNTKARKPKKNVTAGKPVQSKPVKQQMVPTASNSTKSATNSGDKVVLEDFDLREAVIYSEIMKPKFDE